MWWYSGTGQHVGPSRRRVWVQTPVPSPIWSHRLMVRTVVSQATNISSILIAITIFELKKIELIFNNSTL